MATSRRSRFVPDRGDMIYIQHSPHVGREMPGMHPMLVFSSKVFNERTGIVLGFPMSHAEFNADNPFAVPVIGPKNEVSYILAFQPKSFDWRERRAVLHPWGGGHSKALVVALRKLDLIGGICTDQR